MELDELFVSQNPMELLHPILLDVFCFVNVPFDSMVKF